MDAPAVFQLHCAQDRADDALLLPHWSVDDWRALLAHASVLSVPAGEVAVRHGDCERAIYLVLDGALEMSAAAGRHETLGALSRVEPGAVFGEISLFDGQPRLGSVWAVEPTRLLRLHLDGLSAFAREHPQRGHELLLALGRVLALRLRHGSKKVRRG